MLLLTLFSSLAFPYSAGKTGSSTSGCTCHGAAASTTSTSFSVSDTTVEPGDALAVQFIVSTTDGTRTAGGLDVSATGGTLAAGSNNRLSASEITHSSRTSMTSGSVAFDFTWTAPTTEGTYTLYGAGNAVNGNGASSGDGWNSTSLVITVAAAVPDVDGDGYVSSDDCDDNDATINPGVDEVCDGVDNNCDGLSDDSSAVDATTWYADVDGDTYGSNTATVAACTQPSGYLSSAFDCDDNNAAINPGETEVCNGVDDDCDSATDGSDAADASTWYDDADLDGYGDSLTATLACEPATGQVALDGDCDDADADANPDADEVCDGADNNCDGNTDDADPLVTDPSSWYADVDGDGYGDGAVVLACDQPANHVLTSGDCDDADVAYNPGAVEADCTDPNDYNCDGASGATDGDGDGFAACEDCNDADATVNSSGVELCDGVDNDCDTEVDVDASDALTFYADADSDGYGDFSTTEVACSASPGFVADNTDCDDTSSASNPGATEACDGADNNCNGQTDESGASGELTWYSDADGDGYGNPAVTAAACSQPEGYLADNTDCNDTDAAANPAGEEVWYDGVDQDCDGNDADQDGDGYAEGLDDCDDLDANTFPGATDVWYDGVDSDCAGNSDYDSDADGVDSESYGGTDCDDANAGTYPGAPDTPYDGVISDCDDSDEYDVDGDGSAYDVDCDDANSAINPSAAEVWYDGVDQNCDGNDDDQDGDGVKVDADCDDEDASIQTCDSEQPGDSDPGDSDPGDSDPGDSDPGDSDPATDSAPAGDSGKGTDDDCGCDTGGAGLLPLGLLALLGMRRRRVV